MSRIQANALLLAIALIWGLAFVFQKTAMAHVGALLFVAIRCAIGAAALLPLALRESRAPIFGDAARLTPNGWSFAACGAFGGLMFFTGAALQQIGLITATVTNTGFLTGLYVVLTPLLVWSFVGHRPDRVVWAAVALAFFGTWALGGGTIGGFSFGDLLVAISALFWAGHIVVVGQTSAFARPIMFTTIQFAVTCLIAITLALTFEPISLEGIKAAWLELLFVGLLSSAVTFTLLAVAMKYTPTSEAAILVSMETVFAAIAAAILLGERLTPLGWLGAALMFSATIVVNAAPYLRRKQPV
jgi:drug/metabolite transporter (DMT)-like permease